MKDQPTCATCAFFHHDGHCRRFPPTQQFDRWPSMDGNRWCGEHKYVEPIREVKPGSFTANPNPNPDEKTYPIEEVSKLVAQISVLQREIELLHERIAVLTDACQWASGQLRKRTRPDPIDRALHPEKVVVGVESAAVSRMEAMENTLRFILDECDWEEYRGGPCGGGDERIGQAIRKVLSAKFLSTPCSALQKCAQRLAGHIANPLDIDAIVAEVESNEYNAELMLHHLILWASKING